MFALVACLQKTRLAVLGALLALLAVPATAQQQKPSGVDVWSTNCGRCHRARAVNAYNASQWESVVAHMALTARLTPDETQAVREFLVAGAQARERAASGTALSPGRREPLTLASRGMDWLAAVQGQSCDHEVGSASFKAQCAACHGSRGKGDGPAAAALNPRPANLTDSTRMARLSEDSLVQVVRAGRNAMPAYAKILTPQQICEVVAHVRTLRR